MGNIHRFRRRKSGGRRNGRSVLLSLAGAIILGGAMGAGSALFPNKAPATTARFGLCHTGGGTNCVVDGDTIWMGGVKIRIADIDAPETHPPRCAHEADLGNRATERLYELVNRGPFTTVQPGYRDEDRYGRKLRVLMRKGQSLGGILVQEGLARPWDGSRHPWC